ncbi:MAG: hypothetical protein HGA85_06295 [Nanoarchaeota archaeon]|nr:hypothetical protein [Nanoarchaeota archaeon]
MIYTHDLGKLSCSKESDSARFMLTSSGSFFYRNDKTRFRGLYFPELRNDVEWTMFKTLDTIKVNHTPYELVNRQSEIIERSKSGTASYALGKDGLKLVTDVKGEITLTVDMREIYDFGDAGRIYNIFEDHGCIIIEYKKYTSNVLDNISYTRFLAIKTDISGRELVKAWKECDFEDDSKRKSWPSRLYAYECIRLKNNRRGTVAFSYGRSAEEAVFRAKACFNSSPEPVKIYWEHGTIESMAAYNCAAASLAGLYSEIGKTSGYFAGLPWFFQFWTRDLGISAKALALIGKGDEAKKHLMSLLSLMDSSARLPNRIPNSTLGSADGTLWVFKRIGELAETKGMFNRIELESIQSRLGAIITQNGDKLLEAKPGETWMDTTYGGDTRVGPRIEIQALYLATLALASKLDLVLGKKAEFLPAENRFKDLVAKEFYKEGYLWDGREDKTHRPNIFLAYYAYPNLLKKEEWESAFDKCLEKTWLDWGGLSTIDKSHPLFCEEYTGEDNRSYHRGDSWHFLNAIAAICMIKLNKEKYQGYIEKIIAAEIKDILALGLIGRPSELSSAKEERAEGSPYQLWSAAMTIELLNCHRTYMC